jgi:hypothetical protein
MWLTSWFRLSRSGLLAKPARDFGRWAIAEALSEATVSSLLDLLPADGRPASIDVQRIETDRWYGPADVREVYAHTAVVDEYTLSSLVEHSTNSTTSVSIDPQSGRAKEGALFEIEHINRWSLLSFAVTYVNPAVRGIREFLNTKNPEVPTISATINDVTRVVEGALEKIRFFGIGGKRSRGYGRIIVWPVPVDERSGTLETDLPPRTQRAATRIMISYSHANKNVARRLAADLQEQMHDVWLDEREVLVGDSIHTKVEEGVSGCDYLIALLSPASLESAWVREEIDAIRVREKESRSIVLLPAVLEGLDAKTLPALLKDRRFAVLTS